MQSGPFHRETIPGISQIRPHQSMPLSQFNRSVDVISTPPSTGGGGGTSTLTEFPFQMTAGTATLSVRFGTVEDITPDDVGVDIPLVDGDGEYTVYLDVDIDDDGIVTAAAVVVAFETPLPSDTAFKAYKLIGYVDLLGTLVSNIRQSLMFSQGFAACGRDVDDPETTPGTYSFFVD